MVRIGYALSSEEHAPAALVRNARAAEEAGFDFAMVSDHFHPWTDRQGSSPFVWTVIGAIAQATDRLALGTGVTCPTIRTHPAIVAQAAATAAALMPGRGVRAAGHPACGTDRRRSREPRSLERHGRAVPVLRRRRQAAPRAGRGLLRR